MSTRLAMLVVSLLAGCPRPLPPALTAATVTAAQLPEGREELFRYADGEMEKDNIASAENSLVAVEKAIGAHALTVVARDYAALWRAARACAWLAEEFTDNQSREQFAYHGMQCAKAAALRLLGGVFARAPSWPASIGDIDEGIKYLSRAVAVAADYPENHLLYADALAADEHPADAKREYHVVLDLPVSPRYVHRLERWKKAAAAGCKKVPSC